MSVHVNKSNNFHKTLAFNILQKAKWFRISKNRKTHSSDLLFPRPQKLG